MIDWDMVELGVVLPVRHAKQLAQCRLTKDWQS